jgi:hypothetical protein
MHFWLALQYSKATAISGKDGEEIVRLLTGSVIAPNQEISSPNQTKPGARSGLVGYIAIPEQDGTQIR